MLTRLVLISTVLFGATLLAAPAAQALPSDAALALRWAPVHYQDSDSSDYDADYLSTVDFDGDWNAQNNWESQDDSVARLMPVRSASASSDHVRSARSRARRRAIRRSMSASAVGSVMVMVFGISNWRHYLQ